jgi:hypothetical protein
VLEAFVRIAGKQATQDRDASALLLAATHHHDGGVRLDAALAIAANPRMPGAAQALVSLAETDADPRVRRAACEEAGRVGSDVVLPFYERATSAVTDPDFYAACMQVSRASPRQSAYRLFLPHRRDRARAHAAVDRDVVFCDLEQDQRGWFDVEVRRVASVVTDAPRACRHARPHRIARRSPRHARRVAPSEEEPRGAGRQAALDKIARSASS